MWCGSKIQDTPPLFFLTTFDEKPFEETGSGFSTIQTGSLLCGFFHVHFTKDCETLFHKCLCFFSLPGAVKQF